MTSPYRIVIPARLGSSRLPNKPLLDLAGKPLVVRVLDAARSSGAAEVVVATDAEEIAATVRAHGGEVVMTSSEHPSGTDRLAEVVERRAWEDDSIIVNLQGDEPGVPPALLDWVADLLAANPDAGIATLATPIRNAQELFDPSVVKVVATARGQASYFSRAPIPWDRERFGEGPPEALPEGVPFLRHLGLYAYRARTLSRFTSLPPAAIEHAERLEQLRALHAGIVIMLGVVEEPPGHGIDTPEDLERVRRTFERKSE